MKITKTLKPALALSVIAGSTSQVMAAPAIVTNVIEWIGYGVWVLIVGAFLFGAYCAYDLLLKFKSFGAQNGAPKPSAGAIIGTLIGAIGGLGFGGYLTYIQTTSGGDSTSTVKVNADIDTDSFKMK